jgi:hypothetical protein
MRYVHPGEELTLEFLAQQLREPVPLEFLEAVLNSQRRYGQPRFCSRVVNGVVMWRTAFPEARNRRGRWTQ